MGQLLRALTATILLAEIAAIFLGTSVWIILSELHLPNAVIIGAEMLTAVGILILALIIFQRAMAAERRVEAGVPSDL